MRHGNASTFPFMPQVLCPVGHHQASRVNHIARAAWLISGLSSLADVRLRNTARRPKGRGATSQVAQ